MQRVYNVTIAQTLATYVISGVPKCLQYGRKWACEFIRILSVFLMVNFTTGCIQLLKKMKGKFVVREWFCALVWLAPDSKCVNCALFLITIAMSNLSRLSKPTPRM